MKLFVYLSAALGLLVSPSLVLAQESGASTTTVSGTPWVGDRAVGEGAGIRTGSVEWHPGVSVQTGLDTNYLQRAGSTAEEQSFGEPINSWRFRVTPQVSFRSVDRALESGGDERPVPKPIVMFDALGFATYNEILALEGGYAEEFADLRNVEGGAGLGLDFFPGRPVSAGLTAGYSYVAEPSNQGGLGAQFDRHNINVGGKLRWAPGGGTFRWTLLDYRTHFTLFNEGAFGAYDRGRHTFGTNGSWKFLPKTSILYDAQFDLYRYDAEQLNSGEALQARMGVNGLLTKKLALMLMAGWATSFYGDENGVARNYDGVIGQAEAKWFLSADGRLKEGDANVGASAIALGYIRDYNDSYLGNFYLRNRGYLQGSYLIGGRVITTLEGGVSRINYPDFFAVSTGEQPGFGETRVDVNFFAEYRPMKTIGINLQLRYDQNISQVRDFGDFSDDFSFNRFRGILGARWFL